MNTLSFRKKSLYSALIFFGTVAILSVGYALVGNLSTADKVSMGSGLSSASWNRIVDGVLDLDTRLSNFSFSGGNIGIGTASPRAKLDINGNTHISGDLYSTGWTLLTPSVYYTGNVYYKIVGKHVVFRGALNSTLNGRAAGWYYLFDNWPAEIALWFSGNTVLHGWNGSGLIREIYWRTPANSCTWWSCFQIFKPYTDGDPVTQGEWIFFDDFSYELL